MRIHFNGRDYDVVPDNGNPMLIDSTTDRFGQIVKIDDIVVVSHSDYSDAWLTWGRVKTIMDVGHEYPFLNVELGKQKEIRVFEPDSVMLAPETIKQYIMMDKLQR